MTWPATHLQLIGTSIERRLSMRKKSKPQPGDLVLVTWVDITGTTTGDLINATTTLCATPGFYVGMKRIKGVKTLVVVPNAHITPKWEGSSGWDAYPSSVVRTVHVLMRKAEVEEHCAQAES